MNGDIHVRFCERLGVQFPRATHPSMACAATAGSDGWTGLGEIDSCAQPANTADSSSDTNINIGLVIGDSKSKAPEDASIDLYEPFTHEDHLQQERVTANLSVRPAVVTLSFSDASARCRRRLHAGPRPDGKQRDAAIIHTRFHAPESCGAAKRGEGSARHNP
jgi:hypothetical protein